MEGIVLTPANGFREACVGDLLRPKLHDSSRSFLGQAVDPGLLHSEACKAPCHVGQVLGVCLLKHKVLSHSRQDVAPTPDHCQSSRKIGQFLCFCCLGLLRHKEMKSSPEWFTLNPQLGQSPCHIGQPPGVPSSHQLDSVEQLWWRRNAKTRQTVQRR